MEAGELRVAAITDLGGLGSADGPGTSYNWTRPSLLPVLLPWMIILGLLMLRCNRTAQAWLIWVPIVLLVGIAGLISSVLPSEAPAELSDMVMGGIIALSFGLGAVWLLIPHLGLRHPFLTFLGCLMILIFVSALTWVLREGFEGGIEQISKGLLTVVAGCGIAIAFTLCGLACRNRYYPFRISLLLLCALLLTWFVFGMPFLVIGLASGQGGGFLPMFILSMGTISMLSFAVVLPFLLLSFVAVFYKDRLKAFLRLGSGAPPLIAPEPIIIEPVAK